MTDEQVVVAHPVTGERLGDLTTAPGAVLAEVLFELRDRSRKWRAMQAALEGELQRRAALRDRTVLVFGDFEVSAKTPNRSEWDGDALEAVLRDLNDQGVIQAREWTEVIHHETKVSASQAQRLVDRLSGEAKLAVERCRTWRKDRPRVEVTRSVELLTTPTEG
jgi:hypothetical protein